MFFFKRIKKIRLKRENFIVKVTLTQTKNQTDNTVLTSAGYNWLYGAFS